MRMVCIFQSFNPVGRIYEIVSLFPLSILVRLSNFCNYQYFWYCEQHFIL